MISMPKQKIIYIIAGAVCSILTILMIILVATGWGSVALVIGPFAFAVAFFASAASIKTPERKKRIDEQNKQKKRLAKKKQAEEEYVSPFFKD